MVLNREVEKAVEQNRVLIASRRNNESHPFVFSSRGESVNYNAKGQLLKGGASYYFALLFLLD